MVRRFFEEQIRELLEDLLEMGDMVTGSIGRSIQALAQQDEALAQEVIAYDDEINAIQQEIDEKCLVLLATQQPMASDLRAIMAISNIAAELERMGDYTEGIARLAIKLSDRPLLKPLIDIPRMAEGSRRMLTSALEAFARQDVEAAEAVGKADDEIDALYDQVMYILFPPKRIEIDISRQHLWTFEGDTLIHSFPVSTGLPGRDTA
ncbi:MAG: phosphate signaling complex protein PhoU, partial [Anaerolineae bacterium]